MTDFKAPPLPGNFAAPMPPKAPGMGESGVRPVAYPAEEVRAGIGEVPQPERPASPVVSGEMPTQMSAGEPAQAEGAPVENKTPETPAGTGDSVPTQNAGIGTAFSNATSRISAQINPEKVAAFNEKKEMLKQNFNKLSPGKRQAVLLGAVFAFGLLMGAVMFSSSGETAQPAPQGLQGVISNPDIRTPLKRCGRVDASMPCVLYVMNHATYDKLAKDFFDTAVSVTGRPNFQIGTDNVSYARLKIPPGYFAEIKIPAYK